MLGDVTDEAAKLALMDLRSDKSTGPDALPARILKECANVLAYPFRTLARLIMLQGRWPEIWIEHWIIPLHKKNNVYSASNYRGVHLTAQLSKALERLLQGFFYAICDS